MCYRLWAAGLYEELPQTSLSHLALHPHLVAVQDPIPAKRVRPEVRKSVEVTGSHIRHFLAFLSVLLAPLVLLIHGLHVDLGHAVGPTHGGWLLAYIQWKWLIHSDHISRTLIKPVKGLQAWSLKAPLSFHSHKCLFIHLSCQVWTTKSLIFKKFKAFLIEI